MYTLDYQLLHFLLVTNLISEVNAVASYRDGIQVGFAIESQHLGQKKTMNQPPTTLNALTMHGLNKVGPYFAFS